LPLHCMDLRGRMELLAAYDLCAVQQSYAEVIAPRLPDKPPSIFEIPLSCVYSTVSILICRIVYLSERK
jgi:hypothetical protein